MDINNGKDLNKEQDIPATSEQPDIPENNPQDNSNKKKIGLIILGVAVLFGILIACLIPDKPNIDGPVVDENPPTVEQEDTFGEPMEFYTIDEYYGVYDRELEDCDMHYIDQFIESYRDDELLGLWTRVAEYQMPEDFYLMDENDERVKLVTGNKPFIVYFAGIYPDGDGGFTMEDISGNMSILKANLVKTDPDIYILPIETSTSKEDIRSKIPNSNYFYEENRAISDLYSLIGDCKNVAVFFDSKGVPVFATSDCNIYKFAEYAGKVFENNVTMAQVLDSLKDTHHAE